MNDMLTPKTWGTFWDIFGKSLIELLDIPAGVAVLDVGTGGGSVLYPSLKKVGPKGQVTGICICQHCVDLTNSEIERCKIGNAHVHFMDGREMEFEDNSFDYVSAGFIGWDDWFDFDACEFIEEDRMMNEIYRVLKPNGKFGYSTWLGQDDLDWMYDFLLSNSISPQKNYHIENEAGWRKIMTAVGLKDLHFFTESTSYTYETIDFWWKEMIDYAWVKDSKNSDIVTQSIKKKAFDLIQTRLTSNGGIPFKRDVLYAIATK